MSEPGTFAQRLYAELDRMSDDEALSFLRNVRWHEGDEMSAVVDWLVANYSPEFLRGSVADLSPQDNDHA